MRRLVACLLAGGAAGAAEVARRDIQLTTEVADGGFAYTLDSAIGSFSGEDAFDRMAVVRLGGRWAWASAGSPLAPLAGIDVEYLDAPLTAGGLDGYGLALAAGGTWAVAEPLALDLEGFAGMHSVSLTLPGAGGTAGLTGDGTMQRTGLRARLSWHLSPHWSLAAEGGWVMWSASVAGDDARDLAIDGSGPSVGLTLAWRPSSRPGSVE